MSAPAKATAATGCGAGQTFSSLQAFYDACPNAKPAAPVAPAVPTVQQVQPGYYQQTQAYQQVATTPQWVWDNNTGKYVQSAAAAPTWTAPAWTAPVTPVVQSNVGTGAWVWNAATQSFTQSAAASTGAWVWDAATQSFKQSGQSAPVVPTAAPAPKPTTKPVTVTGNLPLVTGTTYLKSIGQQLGYSPYAPAGLAKLPPGTTNAQSVTVMSAFGPIGTLNGAGFQLNDVGLNLLALGQWTGLQALKTDQGAAAVQNFMQANPIVPRPGLGR